MQKAKRPQRSRAGRCTVLSKSAARAFFLGGTAVTVLAFVGLTVDTVGQVPARSHAESLTAAVKRGHDLWTDNNCMGCHSLLGEGAYYAPELTKVISRRGPTWIKTFIRDPEAMYPGRRRMVHYNFTEAQIDDLLAFFTWIEGIDTNGFPPKPDLAPPAAPNKPSARIAGAPEKFRSLCMACHSLDGQGGNVGPALDDVATRLDEAKLLAWLADPPAVKPGTKMPKLPLSDAERADLTHFLLAK
jgi:nitric oxide reductase subunit C